MRKLITVLTMVFVVVGFASAEKLSRTFVAILNADGTYQYQSLSSKDKGAFVRISGWTQNWTDIRPSVEESTDVKVSSVKEKSEWINTTNSAGYGVSTLVAVTNFGDFAVSYDIVDVNYHGKYQGTGFLLHMLMKDDLDQETCVRKFLDAAAKAQAGRK